MTASPSSRISASDDFDSAQAHARCQVARAWLDGQFIGRGNLPLRYAGNPIIMKVTGHPPEMASVVQQVFRPAFRVLEQMTEGKIRVEDHWGASVHADREGVAALLDGRSDLAPCYSGWDSATYRLAQALRLPGLFANAEIATVVSEELYSTFFREDVEKQGILMGRMKATSAFHLFSMHPIRTLSDLAGLRIASNDGIEADVIRALGAVPVPMSSLEKKSAFASGKIDAVHMSDGPAEVFGIGSRARFRTALGLIRNNVEFGMRAAFWRSLPGDLQRILHAWLRAEAQAETQVFYGLAGARARERFRAAGMELIYFAADEHVRILERVSPVIAGFIAREEGAGRPADALMSAIGRLTNKHEGKSPDRLMREAISDPIRWDQ
jgi:TRAP-type C4-dicarboxylate transport system substrate-binding protein